MLKIFVVLLLVSACSARLPLKEVKSGVVLSSSGAAETVYNLVDSSGKFQVIRQVGRTAPKGIVVKRIVYAENGDRSKIFEKNITISKLGTLKIRNKRVRVLRPQISQHTIWLDGAKYFSQLKIDIKKRSMAVLVKGPVAKWNGTKILKFPKSKGIYCFFSQLIECIRPTNFFELSKSKSAGEMELTLLWDGYPFFQEQYSHIDPGLFAPAKLKYEGESRSGNLGFVLRVGEQSIFYRLDKKMRLKKMFWVSQGLSMVRSSI